MTGYMLKTTRAHLERNKNTAMVLHVVTVDNKFLVDIVRQPDVAIFRCNIVIGLPAAII